MDGFVAQDDWPFVARREELALLTDVITHAGDQADGGTGAVVFAEAGVGKTRLVREALVSAADLGHPTGWAVATRSSALTPYSALAHLVSDARLDGHDDAASLHRELADALRVRHGDRRLVLAIDDAHLLDAGSAALVLRLVLTASVTLLATVRAGEPVDDSITALWKDGLCRRLDLERFSLAETTELVRSALGDDVAMPVVERIASASDGNALFARELVLAALGTGTLRRLDGIWRWDGRVPITPRLVDAVGQRLDGLSPAERTTLGLLALADPLPLRVAERVAELACLSGLEAAGLLRIDDEGDGGRVTCRPRHPLYGEVLLAQLGAVECRRLMRIVADALEAEPPLDEEDAMRVAAWRLEAGGDVSAAALLSAATTADRAFDHQLAERLARGALGRGGGAPAAVALARAANGRNRYDDAEATLADAEADALAGDDDLRRAYLEARFAALFHGLSRPEETLAMLGRAAAGHDDSRTQHLVAGLRAHVLVDGGRLQETVEVADTVLSVPDADRTSVLLCAATKGEALIELGRTSRVGDLHARLGALAAQDVPESGRAGMIAALQVLQCQFYDGRADDVVAQLEEYDAALARSRDEAQRGLVSMSLGLAHLLRGTPASARHHLHAAIAALGSSDFGGVRAWTLAMLAQAEALAGDVVAAHRARSASRAFDLTGRSARYEADFVAADALTAMAEGSLTRAAEIAWAGAERAGELLVSRARMLHLALRLGAPPGDVVGPLADVGAVAECDLPRLFHDHAEALAAGDGAALEAVADSFAARGLRLLAAEAAAQASSAHAVAGVPSGATREAARSAALAARCEGARTPALLVSAALAPLSRREREVARLAASGMTNAAIAHQLTVSVRTVESHLYQAFGKLGVDRREDLSGVLG